MDIFAFFWALILYGIAVVGVVLFVLTLIIYVNTNPYPVIERREQEDSFYDPVLKTNLMFPFIDEESSINLSVIVPAYNEENRLPPMLEEVLYVLEERIKEHPSYKYEIIIVSDSSTDGTVKVAQSYVQKYGSEKVRCLKLTKNRGKGGAVRMGVFSCRGATILFADADGASKFGDLIKLENALVELTKCNLVTQFKEVADQVAVIIGSRAHLEEECLATRSIFRNILMYGFHFLVWLFTVRGIKDTQCGFKLFTRKAAHICFQSLHINRWAFDVELLYIAQKLNIPIAEIPIRWTEIDGSKVTPVISWIQMGCDLGLIWLKYTLGVWKIKTDKTE